MVSGADPTFAELVASVAHDLRSPLTSVKGFSATLLGRWERLSDEQKREFLGAIRSDADRIGKMLSDVIDLARLEAGLLELAPQEVDLSRVVRDGVSGGGGIALLDRMQLDVPEGTWALADYEKLRRVVANLVEAALELAPDGHVSVRARANADGVEIEVSGRGTATEPPSDSLNLYAARRLTEAQGGSMEFQSDATRTRFTLRLPAGEAAR